MSKVEKANCAGENGIQNLCFSSCKLAICMFKWLVKFHLLVAIFVNLLKFTTCIYEVITDVNAKSDPLKYVHNWGW